MTVTVTHDLSPRCVRGARSLRSVAANRLLQSAVCSSLALTDMLIGCALTGAASWTPRDSERW